MVLKMKKIFMDSSQIITDNLLKIDEKKCRKFTLTHFTVDNSTEKMLKKIKGDYFSLNFDYVTLHHEKKALKREVMKVLNILFHENNPTKPLIIGLGNSSITCDTLGIATTNKVMATNHFNDFLNIPKVALFNPEVTEKTGISSFSLIEMVVKKLKPTVIIMIDSLATSKEEYLNNCIEINNTGIIPGSAIKENKKIDAKTFNIPVISIGVPLVLELNKNLYTTPNVKEVIEITSTIISEALNDLFF